MRWLDLPFDLPWSLPSRERGLKYDCFTFSFGIVIVAPFTGAWIEISLSSGSMSVTARRSLHGSVD